MGLKASKEAPKGNFKRPDPLEPGGYPGRLVRVIDLGLQNQQAYQGQPKPPAHMISVTYELSDEFLKDAEGNDLTDKPRWVSEEFALNPLSSDLANSTKRYLVLDPEKEFDGDWVKCLGAPCMVNLVQNPSKKTGQIYEKVTSIAALRKKDADKLPELVNEAKFFDLTDPDMEFFNSLPQFMRDKITANLEFSGSVLEKAMKANPAPEKQKKEEKPDTNDQPTPEADGSGEVPW